MNDVLRDRLKKIYGGYVEEYTRQTNRSRENAAANLKPGGVLPHPMFGGFYTEGERAAFKEYAGGVRAEAKKLIGDALQDIEKEMAKAPSVEAARVLSVLKLKKNVSEEEILAAGKAIDDNFLAYGVLKEIAGDNGFYEIPEHRLTGAASGLMDIQRTFDKCGFETKGELPNPATAGFFNMIIDKTLG